MCLDAAIRRPPTGSRSGDGEQPLCCAALCPSTAIRPHGQCPFAQTRTCAVCCVVLLRDQRACASGSTVCVGLLTASALLCPVSRSLCLSAADHGALFFSSYSLLRRFLFDIDRRPRRPPTPVSGGSSRHPAPPAPSSRRPSAAGLVLAPLKSSRVAAKSAADCLRRAARRLPFPTPSLFFPPPSPSLLPRFPCLGSCSRLIHFTTVRLASPSRPSS